MRNKTFTILFAVFLLNLTPVRGGRAEKAFLSDVVLTNTEQHLIVYFTVKDCFTGDMIKAIENGIETTFTFFVRLYEKSEFLWNKKVADIEIKHSIKYDNLKRVYEVRLSERSNKGAIYVRDFEKAKTMMATIEELKIAPLESLIKGRRYRLRMMAELDKIKLPLYLHNILFFLSLWDFQTDWYQIDFRY